MLDRSNVDNFENDPRFQRIKYQYDIVTDFSNDSNINKLRSKYPRAAAFVDAYCMSCSIDDEESEAGIECMNELLDGWPVKLCMIRMKQKSTGSRFIPVLVK